MSQESVEIVRNAFDAFTRGDAEGRVAARRRGGCHHAALGAAGRHSATAGTQRRDGSLRHLARALGRLPHRNLADRGPPGDHVVVATHQTGRGKQSGVEVEIEMTFLFTVRGKRIVEWQLFMREDQALEAAGLSE